MKLLIKFKAVFCTKFLTKKIILFYGDYLNNISIHFWPYIYLLMSIYNVTKYIISKSFAGDKPLKILK